MLIASRLKTIDHMEAMKEMTAKNVGADNIEIVYQRLGNIEAPPLFLVMGGGAQMIAWPDGFCFELVNRGFQVIRYDNRDTGLSTHFNNAPVPDLKAAMAGDFSSVSYTLSDMAADAIGLMDSLGFESAHLVGASMGGMIAQTIAIEYPDRVRSLTSMMSTTGGNSVGQPDFAALAPLGAPPNERQGYIDWLLRSLKVIGSPKYPLDDQAAADRAGRSWDRDHDPLGMLRQSVAVLKSGDRTDKLRKINIPTLVIHGSSDKMCDVSGGRATAEAIPNAKLIVYEGMGHGFPQQLWEDIANHISSHVHEAEKNF